MLITPFGKIRIIADGIEIDYHAQIYQYPKPPVVTNPIEGCFRITVPVHGAQTVQCELISDKTASVESGENYFCVEYRQEKTQLIIGAIDGSIDFSTQETPRGIKYQFHKPVETVVFGVAWTTDYRGTDDCRVWYAADPSIYEPKKECSDL